MKINFRSARRSPEFTSGVIRYGFWVVSTVFIGLAMWTRYYEPVWNFYIFFMLGYFLYTTLLFVSVLYFPIVRWRPYLTIPIDLGAISLAMLFTEDGPFSPFFLFYAWYFVSYALRYGRGVLLAATICSLIGFTILLTLTDTWYSHVYDVVAYIIFLIIMPLYLDLMLRRLKSARDEANRANKAKSEFLAAMSHEVRTPMSGIVGVTTLLGKTELNEDQREYVAALQESSTALNALIDDVLDLSKIEAGKYSLEEERVNLPKTLYGVAQMFTASANSKGLELFFDYDPDLPEYILGDGKRLRQIVLNLVSNAVKFTGKGEVILRAMRAAQQEQPGRLTIRIEVEDTGPGLSAEQKQNIFEPFYQVAGQQQQQQSGTGLGTTIASNLVKLMGGRIGVESTPGQGSNFWLEIPWLYEASETLDTSALSHNHPLVIYEANRTNSEILEKYCAGLQWPCTVASQQASLISTIEKNIKRKYVPVVLLSELACAGQCGQLAELLRKMFGDEVKICKVLHLGNLHQITQAERQVYDQFLTMPVTAQRMLKMLQAVVLPKQAQARESQALGTSTISRFLNILVAEDSPINAKVITTFLTQDGHRVAHVENGRLALTALAQGQFDLVLMDMRMPELDGLEATRRWRAQETDGRHVPIVALTANATTEDKNTCLAAGMDEFLSKPVNQEQLRGLIKSIG